MHARSWGAKHAFAYPVCFQLFDLDELDELQRRTPLFGHNRLRAVAVHDRDYLTPGPEAIRHKLDAILQAHGCADGIERVHLLTNARLLNYVFNPVSFFYCLRADGSLRCVVADVSNTFGDGHVYVLHEALPPTRGFAVRYQAAKAFHVSPFFDLEGRYTFQFSVPGNTVDVDLRLHKKDDLAFTARLTGDGRRVTTGALVGMLLRGPFTSLLTMPRILWQAGRLYFQRRVPVHSRPNPTSPNTVRTAPPTRRQRLAMDGVVRVFGQFRHGGLELVMPDRRIHRFGRSHGAASARVRVLDWRVFWRIATGGDIGLGESYMAGDWESPDLVAFLRVLAANWAHVGAHRGTLVSGALNRLRHLTRANTVVGSRRNIREHYDLGNDFFRLFLDSTMMYSCALFADDAASGAPAERTLEAAQLAKIERILEKAEIGPDDHVLEIGCGWGGFAIEASRRTGCRVTGITVSQEQLELARERVAAAGLEARVRIERCDYRDVHGTFSRVVSIEMLEAVGHANLGAFFASVDRVLALDGRGVIQTITIPDARYDRYRRSNDFIRRHIFPGGHLPCLAALRDAAARRSRLELRDLESIGSHYVPTLRLWRERLLANAHAARRLGLDDVFLRKWEFYFAYCEAGFAEGLIDDVQFVVCRRER